MPVAIGTPRAMLLSTILPGVLYLAMAWNGLGWLAVVLFIMQWGLIHLSGPLFSGLYNIHLPDGARATALSLINGGVTLYIGAGGVLLGWLAGRSLPFTFALMGVVIILRWLLVRLDHSDALGSTDIS